VEEIEGFDDVQGLERRGLGWLDIVGVLIVRCEFASENMG
jgi:hypothetical protein